MRMSYFACLTSCLMVFAPGAAWSKFPDAVNVQITDSVAQTDTKVEGEAPELSTE